MYRLILLAIFLCTFASVCFSANIKSIEGTYICRFHDPIANPPDGKDIVTIKKTSQNFFKITHTVIGSAKPYLYGVGLFNKNINNALATMYWFPKSPNNTFIEYFVINPDGSLSGVFAESNKKIAGSETCKKSS